MDVVEVEAGEISFGKEELCLFYAHFRSSSGFAAALLPVPPETLGLPAAG